MYEAQTADAILDRMLARVSGDIDKRQGSIIYDALAPAAAELAQMYAEIDVNYRLSFADTASGEELARRTAEFGVNREQATFASREGRFYGAADSLIDVPEGGRYSIGGVIFVVGSRVGSGVHTLICETAGAVGNQPFGVLLPIQFVPGLVRAELGLVLVPGEDEETDDALRRRYYDEVNSPAFGGNVADYKQTISAMDGIGGLKVYPIWQGGGTVKCTVIASDWSVPSATLINTIQTAVDPTVNAGTGRGLAPIGHKVTIAGVSSKTLKVETTVTLAGVTVAQIQASVTAALEAYMTDLRKSWSNQSQLVVRVALVEGAILTVPGVIDVTGTRLNGVAGNMTLTQDEIPLLGTVTISG
ncbi:baseplate J/gp47 family protein [Paenibacillus sp. PR3]|uniref:Baseplate J/gp47 family protein n=1 Tax=Paenibacillus terricola TaxID=2763503 RepID=A0ABR8MNP7_9BACL|nr:baseplate J/gp47 family protein [Paenibacillus terricola]MBD3917638.1 baseplate J/gp47 family protein [Paenibacillus terricola]